MKRYDPTESYIAAAKRMPRLTSEEEADLGRRASSGDMNARHELVRRNLMLAVSKAGKFTRFAPDHFDDLVSEANFGIFRATRTWAPGRSRFAAYATVWILHKLRLYLVEKHPHIRRPNWMTDIQSKVRREVELTEYEAASWRSYGRFVDVKVVSVATGDDAAGLMNLVRTDSDPARRVDDADHAAALLSCLSAKDREIVWRHAALEQTHAEIAWSLGVSGERSRQLYARAIERIRNNHRRIAS